MPQPLSEDVADGILTGHEAVLLAECVEAGEFGEGQGKVHGTGGAAEFAERVHALSGWGGGYLMIAQNCAKLRNGDVSSIHVS